MQVTPGPYFLGELLAANLSLRNDSHATYTLSGPSMITDPSVDGICGTVIFVTMSGGSGPQYEPPLAHVPTCTEGDFPLVPGHTMTVHQFVPVTNAGEVTLQAGASFLTQTVTGSDGSQSATPSQSPLDGRWPSIKIAVATATPSDRQITLQQKGTQVQVNAPAAARAHLYYIFAAACNASQGGAADTGSMVWQPVGTTFLQEPNCGDSSGPTIQWWYTVSAPGYAIASGHMGH
jgi:hypothetical protein